jgi:NitT/TauT family transport system ATP-binding protein
VLPFRNRKGDITVLEMRNVNKAFATSAGKVLDEFNLSVVPGEFVSLIGPSGCGKTTALRIVAGLLSPSSGRVVVNGNESLGPSRDKAIVFQHFNLFPWRTAIDNVAYGLEIQGVKKAERLKIAREYLDLVGLSSSEKQFPAQLSGGMRQRIGIARALAIDPKLLLMDEPFGALDALTREYLQGQLARICEERALTTLFVTHSIDEALYLSDRVVVMGVQPGRIIAEFPIKFRKPRSDYNFRAEPEYARIREEIWQLLETQIVRAESAMAKQPEKVAS